MLHQGQEKTRIAKLNRWKSERGALLRGRRQPVVGRSFEEDLALFGRQAREEAGKGNGPSERPSRTATPG